MNAKSNLSIVCTCVVLVVRDLLRVPRNDVIRCLEKIKSGEKSRYDTMRNFELI
jgi:hypothetical protein